MELNSSIAAVVTGGASGLGEATARALAAKGVKVAIFDLQKDKGEKVAAEIGGIFCEVNVTNDESVAAGFEKARAANGQERILVNCAGTGNAQKTAEPRQEDGRDQIFHAKDFDRIIQINLVGTYRCIAMSAAGMLTLDPLEGGERGAIVNTASVAAQDGQIGQASYTASKAGINGHDAGRRARPRAGRHPLQHDPAGPLQHAAPARRARTGEAGAWARRCRSRRVWAIRRNMPRSRCEMITNGYFNGECVRLDGAIRMAPR